MRGGRSQCVCARTVLDVTPSFPLNQSSISTVFAVVGLRFWLPFVVNFSPLHVREAIDIRTEARINLACFEVNKISDLRRTALIYSTTKLK